MRERMPDPQLHPRLGRRMLLHSAQGAASSRSFFANAQRARELLAVLRDAVRLEVAEAAAAGRTEAAAALASDFHKVALEWKLQAAVAPLAEALAARVPDAAPNLAEAARRAAAAVEALFERQAPGEALPGEAEAAARQEAARGELAALCGMSGLELERQAARRVRISPFATLAKLYGAFLMRAAELWSVPTLERFGDFDAPRAAADEFLSVRELREAFTGSEEEWESIYLGTHPEVRAFLRKRAAGCGPATLPLPSSSSSSSSSSSAPAPAPAPAPTAPRR
jgi:predicted kinase